MRNFCSINIRNDRQFIAFTGLSEKMFDQLLTEFSRCLNAVRRQKYQKNRTKRFRRPGGGRRGILATAELKLFFILFYLKNYPTFDVLGGLFDLSAPKAKQNVTKLLPVLKQVEKNLSILPHRHFRPLIQESEIDSGKNHKNQIIIIDTTERLCQRPQHARRQKNYYSGKKRAHTLKNTIISEENKGIIVVGPTAPGRRHDYALLKTELDPDQPGLSSVDVSVDLGYQGIKDRYSKFHHINIPHKKPKKSKSLDPALTPAQKKENRVMGRIRVGVENLIGDLKIFAILANKFRNRTIQMADQTILLIAGLANLKNGYIVQ
jgi:hypothetical protein